MGLDYLVLMLIEILGHIILVVAGGMAIILLVVLILCAVFMYASFTKDEDDK